MKDDLAGGLEKTGGLPPEPRPVGGVVPITFGEAVGGVEIDEVEGVGRQSGENLLGNPRAEFRRKEERTTLAVALPDEVLLLPARIGSVAEIPVWTVAT